MTNRQLARIHSAIRIRLGLRQEDVALRGGIGRWKVHRLEAADLDLLRLGDIRRSFEALGARVDLTAFYRGAEMERLLDDVHARLVAAVLSVMNANGWETRAEVTFNVRGERGSIDVLGWHAASGTLLVVEVKSELPGIDRVLRPLDAKVRLAREVARSRFGWRAAAVSRILVLPEDSSARRFASRYSRVLDPAFPAGGREVRRWLRQPGQVLSGLWFLSLDRSANGVRNPSSRRRVMRPRTRHRHAQRVEPSADIRLIDPHKVGHSSE